jgi:hypothetical protein
METTNAPPCGCKTYREGKTTVREVCGRHLVLHDAKGNRITFDKQAVGPHLGRDSETIKQRKGKR